MDKKQVKRIADVEAKMMVKGHEKKVHGMKAGGPTSMDRMKTGRNMSRSMNQGGK